MSSPFSRWRPWQTSLPARSLRLWSTSSSGLDALAKYVAAVWVLVASACAVDRSPPQIQPGSCYEVSTGAWTVVDSTRVDDGPAAPPDRRGDSLSYVFPVRVRLDSAAHEGTPGGRVMTVPDEVLQVPHRYHWWRVSGDTLQLVLSTGYAGLMTRLLPDDTAWAGSAVTWSDGGGRPLFSRSVRLDPASCSSPAPVPASADRPLPRQIELATGALLAVGRSVPSGTRTSDGLYGNLLVEEATAGAWAGADSVFVRLSPDSLVRRIDVRYPPDHDLQALATMLEGEFGPARRSESRFLLNEPRRSWRWSNRTTDVVVRESADGGIVQLEDPRF